MPEYYVVGLGAFLAAVVSGGAGFAFALVATGVWAYVLAPVEIVLLAAICATLIHVTSVVRLRRDVQYRLLVPFLLGGAVGVPLGALALGRVEPAVFRIVLGVLMVTYGTYVLARPSLPALRIGARTARVADTCVGLLGGVMGGFANLHGVLPTIWCAFRGWDKRTARGVYQPFILFAGTVVILAVGLNLDFDRGRLTRNLLVCLPALAVGFHIGLRIFQRVSENGFRRLIAVLIQVSGALLLLAHGT